MEFCPKCNRVAEYDSYHERTYCTSCNWRSEKLEKYSTISEIINDAFKFIAEGTSVLGFYPKFKTLKYSALMKENQKYNINMEISVIDSNDIIEVEITDVDEAYPADFICKIHALLLGGAAITSEELIDLIISFGDDEDVQFEKLRPQAKEVPNSQEFVKRFFTEDFMKQIIN